MVVDGLLPRLYNANYQAQGYADDVVFLETGKLVSMLCNRMQGALNCVENWCREIGPGADWPYNDVGKIPRAPLV
jgi:hypothetical protein